MDTSGFHELTRSLSGDGLALSVIVLLLVLWVPLLALVLRLRARLESLRGLLGEEWSELLTTQHTLQTLVDQQSERRLAELERRLRAVQHEVERLSAGQGGLGVYAEAIREVQQGAGVEDLMASRGIARGEAELIVALHARAPQAS